MFAVGLIVTVENVRQYFRTDSISGVTDNDFRIHVILLLHRLHNQTNSSLRGVFYGIAQQIVQYGSDDVCIKVKFSLIRINADVELHFSVAVQFFVP